MSIPDQHVLTSVGVLYVFVGYHRNQNREKSQWTVTTALEAEIFENSYAEAGGRGDTIWGLWLIQGQMAVIGISRAVNPPRYDLKIAKFKANEMPLYWHGYPADYKSYPQDRPPTAVLRAWMKAGVIEKSDASRIRGGKSCNL